MVIYFANKNVLIKTKKDLIKKTANHIKNVRERESELYNDGSARIPDRPDSPLIVPHQMVQKSLFVCLPLIPHLIRPSMYRLVHAAVDLGT